MKLSRFRSFVRRLILSTPASKEDTHAQEPEPTLGPGEPPLLVFISSLQSSELQEARDIATNTIESFPVLAMPWAFEYTPAASEQPDKTYLRKVRECDIFIWLVGDTTTTPVKNEVQEAVASKRSMLVFSLTKERDSQTESLLETVAPSSKYRETSVKELRKEILYAIGDTIARALRNKPGIGVQDLLDEMERRSKGRCVASWQSIGLPTYVAISFSEDDCVGKPATEMFPSAERPVILILGNIGCGKSLLAERIYQAWINGYRNDSSLPLPIFLKAQVVAGCLEEEVIKNSSSLGDPRLQGVSAVIDGADEAGLSNASSLLDEARVLSRTWPNSSFVITSRPIPVEAREELVQVPELDEITQVSLIGTSAGRTVTIGMLSSLPPSLKDAIKLPLFALLLGKYLSVTNMLSPSSTGEMIDGLMDHSIRGRKTLSEDISKELQKLARLSTERNGGPVPESEVAVGSKIQELIDTMLVIRDNRCLSFQLPIFRQWFAAHEFLDDATLSNQLVSDNRRLERWRYSYVIAVAIFDKETVSTILRPVVGVNPGLASEIISEGLSRWGISTDVYPPPSIECGRQVRDTMECWLHGIGRLSALIGPVNNKGDLVPTGARTSDVWLSTAWYFGPDELPNVFDFGEVESVSEFFPDDWKIIKGARPGRQSAWAWKWSHEQLVHELSCCLFAREIPIVDKMMSHEIIWELMLKATGRGVFYSDPIPLQEMKNIASSLKEDDKLGIHRCLVKTIEYLEEAGIDLTPPWQGPDKPLEKGKSFWVWEPYSDDQLLARTKVVLSGALDIYEKIATEWFGNLSGRMNTAVTLPGKLVGEVKRADSSRGGNGGPAISWYLEALPKDAQSSVELSLCNEFDAPIDLRPIQVNLKRLRPEASEWISTFHQSQGLDFVFGTTPATELAHQWLWDDLNRMSWVEGILGKK